MGATVHSSEVYSEYAAAVQFADLPSDVLDLCKLILLDSIGAAAGASGVIDRSALITSYARGAFGGGKSALWGHGGFVSPMAAAFANGALAHALNYDVVGAGYAGLIPPVVLAAADCTEVASGRDLLTAMAVGVELVTRIQDVTSHIVKRYDRIIDGQLQTYFGCAIAAAKMMRLPAPAIDSALGLALMQAAGPMQITLDGDPEAKAYYGAFPNQSGLQSALLAREGLRAACNAFSGKAGLFPLFYGVETADDALLSNLGKDHRMRRVRFKRWPTSAAFAEFMKVALDIRTEECLQPDRIARVDIVTNPTMRVWFEPHDARRAPENVAAAGNSAPFAIAAVLANGDFTLDELTQDGLAQASIRRIASKIEAHFSQAVGDPSQMTVATVQGGKFTRSVNLGTHSTLSWLDADGVRAKFKKCLAYAHDRSLTARAGEIVSVIENLDDLPDCRSLNRLLADGS